MTEQGVADRGPVAIGGSQTVDVDSKAVGATLRLTIAPPLLYDAFDYPLPTVYVLDGNLCLPIASSVARTLQMLAFGLMPPVLCVGIGYPSENLVEVMSLRTRDLTPTSAQMPPSPMPVDTHGMGGADRLLDALSDEIFPVVEERFRSNPSDRTLVGWSLGGLFALHTLFTRPDVFARYLVVSPSIWWDDRTVLKSEAEYAGAHDDLSAKVYACVGEREETAPSRMWPSIPADAVEFAQSARMVSNLDSLVATLRARRYPGLELTHDVFADEHHATVFPAAVTRGLRALFDQ